MISSEKIVTKLETVLSENFNIDTNVKILDRIIPLVAQSKIAVQQYAVSKKIVLDEAQLHDHLLIWPENSELSIYQIMNYCNWIEKYAELKFLSKTQNMRSRFVGIMVCENKSFDQDVKNKLKKYHKFRWLKLGLNGWYETFFIAYFVQSHSWILPRKGNDFLPLLESLKK